MALPAASYLLIAFLAVIGNLGIWWLSGYTINVALLGMLTPLFVLVLLVVSLVAVVAVTARLFTSDDSVSRRWSLFGVSVLLCAANFGAWILSAHVTMHGFQVRAGGFSEAEFTVVGTKIRELAGSGAQEQYRPGEGFGRQYYEALASDYPLLRISSWPSPNIRVDSARVSLEWGSGLTGTMEIVIWSESAERGMLPPSVRGSHALYPTVELLLTH